MPGVRKLVIVLAAASVAGLVPTAACGSSYAQTTAYPWVQPPFWTGLVPAAEVGGLPVQAAGPTQPPASVPIGPPAPYRASTGYQWAQPWPTAPATAPTPTQP